MKWSNAAGKIRKISPYEKPLPVKRMLVMQELHPPPPSKRRWHSITIPPVAIASLDDSPLWSHVVDPHMGAFFNLCAAGV